MAQITHWLNPDTTYNHKTQGIKTNRQFCEEIVNDVNRNPKRQARIIKRSNGDICVFSERKSYD